MTSEPSESVYSGVRTGPLAEGEWVRLTDSKGRKHNICLEAGKSFFTNKGEIKHDALIGREQGFTVATQAGAEYLVFRPVMSQYVVSMPRGAAVIYPKDASQILSAADIYPGARVVEAGAGSGALTCHLLRAVGPNGRVTSYEVREDFADIARRNVEQLFAGPHPAWDLRVGDLGDSDHDGDVDRMILDMVDPWEYVDVAGRALVAGGFVCAYVATTTQLSRVVETIRAHGEFTEPHAWESLVRDWHVEGLAVRPEHKMLGHTAYLAVARRMAHGERAPLKKRRPAPGAYGPDYTGPRPPGVGAE